MTPSLIQSLETDIGLPEVQRRQCKYGLDNGPLIDDLLVRQIVCVTHMGGKERSQASKQKSWRRAVKAIDGDTLAVIVKGAAAGGVLQGC